MKLITTTFGMKSTAEEVAGQIDLKGKRAIVTGGASGIVEILTALNHKSSYTADKLFYY